MRDTAEPVTVKPGRCDHHPGVAAVGLCDACGRALCVGCAVPVRGTTVGPECLSAVLEDAPTSVHIPSPVVPRGDWLARIGFTLVVALGVLPWSRVGEGSGPFGAWTLNWSLLAVTGGLAGVILLLFGRYRLLGPRMEALAYAVLGGLVVIGSSLHLTRPPLLAEPSASPLLALVAAGLVLLGAALKAAALLEAGRLHG